MKIQLILCGIDDLESNSKKRFVIGDQAILVIRNEDELYAIEDRCTHDTASLSAGKLKGYEIECPRHGAKFDIRTGEVTTLPGAVALRTYNIMLENGEVIIEMELDGQFGGGCCGGGGCGTGNGCGGGACGSDKGGCGNTKEGCCSGDEEEPGQEEECCGGCEEERSGADHCECHGEECE
jgi:3-phenylpropionate/trans-cinnamate dioxygenase ferredoxin component